MFGKLKDKLKSALSIFSKKTEEEAEEKVVEIQKEAIPEVPEVRKEQQKVKKEPAKAAEKKRTIEKKPETPEKKREEKTEKKKEAILEKKAESISPDEVRITYFVHGTTTDNEKDLATGWNQGELSNKGIQQSKELWEKVKDKKLEVVFCSDLKRAVDSAHLTFRKEVPIIEDKRLRECNYGEWNGKEAKVFKSKLTEYVTKPFPSGESYKQVERRIADFLNYAHDNYHGKRIAIVAHQAPQLAMDVLLKGKTWEQAIQEDWRLRKAWQPGWEYTISQKIILSEETPSATPEEKKGFFTRIKETFVQKEECLAVEQKVEEKIEKETPEVAAEKGFFDKIKQTLTTKTISAEKFEELFWDLELALLENNVSIEVIDKIKEDLKKELVEKPLPRDVSAKIEETLKHTLESILSVEEVDIIKRVREKEKKPFVIAFFGINGTGKTTSIAKLTHYFQQQHLSVVLAACDTFRAAAIQQLEEHAQKLKVKIIKHDYGADAAAVAFDAIKYAEKNNIDLVLIDTAGRLHSNTNLMAELEKIIRIAKPDLKIFVGESITGNDCIEQAKKFNDLVEMDGAILTKVDVDEKGGAPLSIAYTIKKPILFLGVGQRYEDLEKFDPQVIVARLGF